MWKYRSSDELYHHGILGMRWGVRRYQNKDGSLTPAGRKRADKLKKEYVTVTGKRIYIKRNDVAKTSSKQTKQEVNKPKTIKNLSNKELESGTARMQLEKKYIDASKELKKVSPKKINKGKVFVDHVKTKVIIPAMTDAAKSYMTSVFKSMINSTLPDPNNFGKKKSSK